MYLTIGVVFLLLCLLLAAAIAFTAVRTIKRRGPVISKINFIYLAPTFVLIYLLLVTASAYNGEDINFFYLFSLIGQTLEVLAFSVNSSLILPICREFPIYYVIFVLAFIVGGVTVILSVVSLFSRRIRNFVSARRRLACDCDVIIGDCADAVKYMSNTTGCVLIAAEMPSPRFSDLIKDGYTVVRCPFDAAKLSKKLCKGTHNVIVFRSSNLSYTDAITLFASLKLGGCDLILNLEADQEEVRIIKEKFISSGDTAVSASIACFNKYEVMVKQLTARYPITKYIPRSFFNPNLTLKEGRDINVAFIGFGKVNYQLFRMFATQFQFAAQSGDRLVSAPVNYYIFDNRDGALHNEFFSRIFYEFDEAFENCDFPKPERICNVNIKNIDINSVEAKRTFRQLVSPRSFTYFCVSLSDDLQDASYAQTIIRLMPEERNYRIFVRARNTQDERLSEPAEIDFDPIIYFGEEKRVFSHGGLIDDDVTEFAQRLNLLYENINNPPEWLNKIKSMPGAERDGALKLYLKSPKNRAEMRRLWGTLPLIEQTSNIHRALNMPFKINLLGFDMVKGLSEDAVSREQFDLVYVNSGRDAGYNNCNCFFDTQPSNVLAFIEHSRWNALYILYDYRQMKKYMMQVKTSVDAEGRTFRSVPHKDTAHKLHACLTTYYGLKELIEFKFSLLYPGEDFESVPPDDERLRELYKIYVYDYFGLDELFDQLSSMGYTLIKNTSA